MTVLVIDHDAEFRVALADFLTDAGFLVWQATSASEALQRLHAPGGLPQVVLVGLALRGGAGASLLEAIRQSPAGHLPVVALTGYASDEAEEILRIPAVAKWQADRLLALLRRAQARIPIVDAPSVVRSRGRRPRSH